MRFLPLFLIAAAVMLVAALLSMASRGRVRPGDPSRYRPRSGYGSARTGSQTPFEDASPFASHAAESDSADLPTDFFTGAALDPQAGVVRCEDCRALYHPDSAELLTQHNGGCCASCGGTSLRTLAPEAFRRTEPRDAGFRDSADSSPRDRALIPEPIDLQGYLAAVGRAVTLGGTVVSRLPAMGNWPAMLMRDSGGVDVRLVFVDEAGHGLKGKAFASSLLGSSIRLRGLLLRDEAHGLRLLVSDTRMVLEVRN